MYSAEQKRAGIETCIRFDHSSADAIAELGHPSRAMPKTWWKEYKRTEQVPERKPLAPVFSGGQMQSAVSCCLEHGRGLSRARRAMGFKVECDGLRRSMSRKGCSPTMPGWKTYVLKRITTPRPRAGRGHEGILRALREGPRIQSGGHAGSIEIWNHSVHYIDRAQCARKACGIPPQVMGARRACEEPCIARACAGGEAASGSPSYAGTCRKVTWMAEAHPPTGLSFCHDRQLLDCN